MVLVFLLVLNIRSDIIGQSNKVPQFYHIVSVIGALHRHPLPTTPKEEDFFVYVEYALVRVTVEEITQVKSVKDYVKIFLTSVPNLHLDLTHRSENVDTKVTALTRYAIRLIVNDFVCI
jgi:hypothetical protein